MFRLIRYAILGAIAFLAATWISESRGDVGIERVSVTDPVSGKLAPTALWYPTSTPPRVLTFGPYTFSAARGAAPDKNLKGLIVFSHGSGGGSFGQLDTALELARAGFVVAAPFHPGDNFEDLSAQGAWETYAGRPKTLSAAIDKIKSDPRFADALADKPVGALGLSMGGYTVLALAGAEPSLARMGTFCARYTTDTACRIGIARPSAGQRDKPLAGLADARISAVVVMAPLTAVFAEDGFADITIPVRLYVAGQDGILDPDLHGERFRAHFPAKLEYVRDEAAGHLSYLTPLPPEIERRLPAFLQDPPGFERRPFLDRVNREVVSFFTRTMR